MKFDTWVPCWFKIKVNCGVKMQAEFITDACAVELLARFVREASSGITALLRQKLLLILKDRILWDFVAPPGCPNLSQNYFSGNLNTALEVQGAWFLSIFYPVSLVREMWDITRSKCTVSTWFVPGLRLLQHGSRSGSLVMVVWDEPLWATCRISQRLREQSHWVCFSAQRLPLPD